MASKKAEGGPLDVLAAVGDLLVLAEPNLLHLWKDSRLTLGSLRVLRSLVDEHHSPGELAGLTGMAPPTMARLLTRLEERGLVSRSIDPADRRRIEVRLTASGRETLNRAHVLKGSAFQLAAETLPPAERMRLVTALAAYAAAVRALQSAEPAAQGQPA